MDWLETWRDSWSTGSATAASSSSSPSSEGAPNANDDTRAAAPENGKKRKHKVATAASSPSDEPRRTKRVRKPTAALAEFRIELSTRRNRTGLRPDDDAGGDSEQLLIPTRRARTRVRQSTVSGDKLSTTTTEYASNRYSTRTNPAHVGDDLVFGTSESGNTMLQVEETAVGTLNQRKQRILWTPAEDARLRTAILTFAGLDPTTTDISVGHVKVKTSEWPEVKRIFDALAPPESASSGPPRSVHSLQGHFYTALLRRSQRAPPVTVPAEAGPSPSGSHSPVSPAPSLSAVGSSSATPGTNLVEEAPQRVDRSANDSGQDERREESAPPNQAVAVESFDSAAAAAFFPGSDVPMSGSLRLEDVLTALTTAGSATAPATTSSLDAAAAQPGNLDSSTPRPGHSDATLSPEEHGHLTGHIPGAEGSPEAADGTNFGRSQEPNPTSEAGGTPEAGTSGAAATSFTPSGNVNSASSASAGSGTQPAGTGGKATGYFTAAEDARIIELFDLGMPQIHIAEALNRPSYSLYGRVAILRQHGLLSKPQPQKQPALGASVPSIDPSPSAVTKNAQQAVTGSNHSAMIPASSSSMIVPSSQARVDDPPVGPSSSKSNPAAPKNGPDKKATAPKRFSAEEDQQIVELRASGIDWQMIGSRLQRTKAACGQRYARLKEKAQLAGKDLSSFVQLPKPVAAGGQAGEASIAPPPISSTPAQQPAAATTPLPPYTVEDDSIILRLYLQGNSAERIGVAIKRSGFSVQRRWNKKKDGWIAAGLLTAGSRLKLHDDPPDQPVVSAATKSPVDPFADLRAPPTGSTSVQQETCGPISSSASCTPTLETETAAENDLGGFDASFWSNDDMAIDPALLNIGADWPAGPASKAAYPQLQDPAVASPRTRQESPLVPTASKQDSSTPEMAAEKMLAGAMPHYDSGMQGLNRFLRLVNSGGKKKC